MASFVTDLWESIFTPGPTPTLLRAANATFLALQLTLAGLLFATHSIHCVILSIICAGLWWSVNWFAAELAIVQREQAAKDKAEEDKRRRRDDGSDTEVEEGSKPIPEKDTEGVSASKEVEMQPATQGLSQRKGLEVESAKEKDSQVSQSSVSTEDEWEKVSEGSEEKDQ
ncbi:ER protein Pkr1-domain-containing protein [Emericellopsis atlantica]|uniref:ER protein Pkr1-domain-containing protein n=1 Tax=Emericellopsis atlantica TaxID=2614577 RepID=A0A9P8CKG9_9HYPO|nr:ER protein Pkr1-domain-containing protein [Emericellopsis atlantica]KAG9250032.1 ER protein Pkr1-domain-containing protein [Emericellopsis atlantica]